MRRNLPLVRGAVSIVTSAFFCVLIAGLPVPASAAGHKSHSSEQQIRGQQRVLQVLNRFTFGPRPGDVAAVQAMGVRRWFEEQLNPSHIDDSALEAKLAIFPAMRMDQAELLERYPSPAVLRQTIAKNLPLPADPLEHAIYADEIASYEAAKAKREAKQAATMGARPNLAQGQSAMQGGSAAFPGDRVDPSTPAMKTHEQQLYSGLDAVKLINLPAEERMQRILAMEPEEWTEFRKGLSASEQSALGNGLSPIERETLAALGGAPRMVSAELKMSRMVRDIFSERQLEAVMTDFWLNHFNVYVRKNQDEPYLLPAYEREVIRPRALGKFEDLLVATAQSPAMLMYLDNWQSVGPDSNAAGNSGRLSLNPNARKARSDRGLNENYARELMELHTLGVQCEVSQDRPVKSLNKACKGGYTQQDVTEVAKVFTGWTIDQPYRTGTYRFEERRHEPGDKKVLGKTIHENGEREGLQVLHMLATNPATARFISTELAVRFVSDTPPPALVDRMSKAFLKSGGDIKTVLRAMFDSPEFWSSEVYRAKIKTPEEFVISAVRASGAEVSDARGLVQSLDRLGMPFYGMQTPNGYSWRSEAWVNTGDLVNRMNFALNLSANRVPGVLTDWPAAFGNPEVGIAPAGYTAGDAIANSRENTLEALLLGQPASQQTRSTVLQQFDNQKMQQQAERSFSIRTKEQEPMAQVLNVRPKQQIKPPVDRETATMAGLLLGSPEFQRR